MQSAYHATVLLSTYKLAARCPANDHAAEATGRLVAVAMGSLAVRSRTTYMNPQRDEAGPLWLLLENFFESLPVKPKWILLALAVAALIALAFVAFKPRK